MTAVELRRLTRKDLAQHAKRGRIDGWHGMKKDELVKALLNQQRKERRRRRNGDASKSRPTNGTTEVIPRMATICQPMVEHRLQRRGRMVIRGTEPREIVT